MFLFLVKIALKCADISNPCRSWNISRLWSYRACEEFFRQGDKERELNLPVTPFCDRQNISVAKVQSTFYRYVASPLFEEWHRFLDSPLSTIMTRNLTSNQARWDLLVQQEGPASMAESVISQTSTSSSSGGGSLHLEPPGGRENFPPSNHRRFSRSSADDDDSDPCMSYPYLPLDESPDSLMSRRHSLPFTITYYDEDMFVLGSHLHRQFSLGERRTRQAELLAATAQYRAVHRRRVFASRVTPQATVYDTPSGGCSLNSSMEGSDPPTESSEVHRVTFHIGSGSSPSLSPRHLTDQQQLSSRQDSTSTASSCPHPSCRHHLHQSASSESCTGIRTRNCDPRNNNTNNFTCNQTTSVQSKTSKDDDVSGRLKDNSAPCVNVTHSLNANNFRSFQQPRSFDSSTDATHMSCDFPTRVSFHIGNGHDDGLGCQLLYEEEGARTSNKENLNNIGRRRGSAPSHLLLNQINRAAAKLATTATAVAESLSRESSPNQASKTSSALDWSHRRGSLPSNLVNAPCCQQRGGSMAGCKNCTPSAEKKRKHHLSTTNKSGIIVVKLSGSSDHLCEKPNNCGYGHAKRPLRRGSFRSSSFGGIGTRRGSATIDTPLQPQRNVAYESLPKEWLKKNVSNNINKKRNNVKNNFLNTEDVFHDMGNFSSHIQLIKTPSKISSSNQLLAKQSSYYNNNGRRGSLPVEYLSLSYIR